MIDSIQSRLQYMEAFDAMQTMSLRVIFACESGSRAWGFASRDSDYDVRFVYVSPLRRYSTGRDVIEPKDLEQFGSSFALPLDFSGWDVWKFVGLLAKSNPTAFEWLASPIVYRDCPFFAKLRALAPRCFSPRAAMHHYRSMAKHNFREHMEGGEASAVRLKKYLYICRPLLCLRWIEKHGVAPPMRLADLLEADLLASGQPSAVRLSLERLAERKRSGDELDEGPVVPELNEWISSEIERAASVADAAPTATPPTEEAFGLVREAIDIFMADTGPRVVPVADPAPIA